jgi:hypothetical protein
MEQRIKKDNPEAYVTMEDLLSEWIEPNPRQDTNRRGDEFLQVTVDKLEECISKCKQVENCVAYSFDGTTCSLKWKINVLEKDVGTISGVMHSNFKCNSEKDIREAKELMVGL